MPDAGASLRDRGSISRPEWCSLSMRMNAIPPNPLLELRKLGQSVWLDDIGRAMLDDGSLARLIERDGIAGLTSNPAIFASSMMKEPRYAQAIATLLPKVYSSMALYEELAIEDLRRAADLLRRDYDSTSGGDGFVSLEVSPHLAHDTVGSVAEGQRLDVRAHERPPRGRRVGDDPARAGRRLKAAAPAAPTDVQHPTGEARFRALEVRVDEPAAVRRPEIERQPRGQAGLRPAAA